MPKTASGSHQHIDQRAEIRDSWMTENLGWNDVLDNVVANPRCGLVRSAVWHGGGQARQAGKAVAILDWSVPGIAAPAIDRIHATAESIDLTLCLVEENPAIGIDH